jgi:hypothetical protein
MTPIRTTFLYLVFGQDKFFLESKLSIASILHFSQQEAFDYQIVIYTDQPNFYQHETIVVHTINEQTIKEWSGENNYIYRSKIACMKDCMQGYPQDNIVMMDTDTVFKHHPKHILMHISPNQCIMHFNEGRPSLQLTEALKKEKIKTITNVLPNTASGHIWNSGVIGIHPTNHAIIQQIIEFNDAFYKETRYFATEQYAFSIVLESCLKLVSAHHSVFHYWHKTYKEDFYQKAEIGQLQALSINQLTNCHQNFTPRWPITQNIGLRIRAYIYFLFRVPRFRVYYSMFV